MKRKLINSNKKELTKFFKLPYIAKVLMYGDKQSLNQQRRHKNKMIQVKDFENAYRFFGRIAVPIVTSSKVKRSRIKNHCYSVQNVKNIEVFNEMFGTNKTIEDLNDSNIYWRKK